MTQGSSELWSDATAESCDRASAPRGLACNAQIAMSRIHSRGFQRVVSVALLGLVVVLMVARVVARTHI